MRQGMLAIVPGMVVKVETVVTRSLNKADRDPRYLPEAHPQSPPVVTVPINPEPAGAIASRKTEVGSPST